jgi:hypothetical protein
VVAVAVIPMRVSASQTLDGRMSDSAPSNLSPQ